MKKILRAVIKYQYKFIKYFKLHYFIIDINFINGIICPMSHTGCNHGCIHKKEIKVEQMKELYLFRCAAQKKYITKDEVKTRCSLFQGPLKIKEHSIDEFLS